MLSLERLTGDIADALQAEDASRPKHKNFRPGIGPFGEPQIVKAIATRLRQIGGPYSKTVTKRLPDLLIPQEWAIEVKLARPFGDNDLEWEHWSESLLHPYPGNRSVLAGCLKLIDRAGPERRSVAIIGYEHSPPRLNLEAVIRAVELIASEVCRVRLGKRCELVRAGLVHPVHQQSRLVTFEVLGVRDQVWWFSASLRLRVETFAGNEQEQTTE